MWDLNHKQSWAPKNWCFWTMVLEKTLEGLLDCKEVNWVNPKGNQSWIFIKGLMLKMKLQYFSRLMWRIDFLKKKKVWCWQRLKAEEEEDRVWDGWIASLTWWTWVWASSRVGEGQGSLHPAVYGVTKCRTQLSDWSELWDIWDTSQILNINVFNFSLEQEERKIKHK